MNLKEKLLNLPKKPGCYQMKDSEGKIIYVGKAKNLYNRVNSYFRGSHDAKTTKLVSQIVDFEYIITSTETEALILEINLIKKYDPKYNILLTDDKTYPYICLTSYPHPRIIYTRDLNKKNCKYFGPYPNVTAARDVCDMLNKMYPLRKCNQIPKKECLYYHLHQCLAPCINKVEKEQYDEILGKINSFLKGNVKDEIQRFKKLMNEASNNLDYEKAIECRNIISSLEHISEKQKMEVSISDTDIFNYALENEKISIQVFHIRDNKMIERNGFLFDLIGDEEENFITFIMQFYLINNNPFPKEILLPMVNIEFLDESIKKYVSIPKQGKKLELLKLVKENALEKLGQIEKSQENKYNRTIGAIKELGTLLNIEPPTVIEAFDNSNIQGASSVSAMVSYFNGSPNKKNYRKYKVKTVVGADDYHTMYEVINRRYSRLKVEGKEYPNLIVIDGGKPQVSSAQKALDDIGVNINILGLVKDDNHRTDSLLFNDEIIKIDKRSNLFLLLESIQDEVHRYAITFHHLVHGKNTFKSELDNIKGIGKVKKQAILRLVGTKNFNEENLKKIKLNGQQITEIIKLYK